ncbi:PHP domain-containing protein [candidate division KSB1 bacterium]|nr:PHP domain-containing protein [candidate division KSB1 bacterium]
MTPPKVDFHIHTKYLGCANQTMKIPAIITECERLGIHTLGITDHLNTIDQLPKHAPILEDIKNLTTDIRIYFGVELNFTGCDEDFVYNENIIRQGGFQFAIGGIHSAYTAEYNVPKIIEIQHRHHLKTCENPLVRILVHPYWFSENQFKEHGWRPISSVKVVPESFTRELGQVAKATGTAIEINACANLRKSHLSHAYVEAYFEYLSILEAEGVMFALGSDAHDINELAEIRESWRMAERLNLTEDRIWQPEGEPINH